MSEVELCNDALAYFGKARINSLQDPEPAARLCNQTLARTIREFQASYDWGFNLTDRDIAAQSQASKIPGFRYKHLLPVDYLRFAALGRTDTTSGTMLDATFNPVSVSTPSDDLRVLRLRMRASPVPMRIAGGFIHTQYTPIRLLYHKHVTNIDAMPDLVRQALALQQASKLVFPLTRDMKLTDSIRVLAADALSFARDEEGLDEYEEEPEGSSFQDARR